MNREKEVYGMEIIEGGVTAAKGFEAAAAEAQIKSITWFPPTITTKTVY